MKADNQLEQQSMEKSENESDLKESNKKVIENDEMTRTRLKAA